MRFIPESTSAKLASHELAYAAISKALVAACESSTATFPVVAAHGSDPRNTYAIKSSATAVLAGLKLGSYWPDNDTRGLPRHNSVILMLDQNSGRIEAVIEAGLLNAFRTSAANAVATDVLSRPESSILAVFGTGHQAGYEIRALSRVREFSQVLVVGRNAARCVQFLEQLKDCGIRAQATSPEDACRAADVIVTATTSTSPLFDASWVQPGTHVSSMGSDAKGKQELPPELFDRALLFCDLPSQSREIGEFQHASSQARLNAIGDVLAARCSGRNKGDDITVFDSSGLSVQDLYIGKAILDLDRSNVSGDEGAD